MGTTSKSGSRDTSQLRSHCKYCDSVTTPGTRCEGCGARAEPKANRRRESMLVGFEKDGTPIFKDVPVPSPPRPKTEPEYMWD